ncbi:t14 [Tupaiid betaherpesvirus 1]|uniref:T14 n=1 Tax=Tupaiid herpesvirus 1 (strain 1) TaxID=10397 RepID=Q91TU8_TUHV1|nr:t14 [Tupaiid betaherpesvirus 1]AAK57039.1 t14 [Tupaiid betaherpesvirus 1]
MRLSDIVQPISKTKGGKAARPGGTGHSGLPRVSRAPDRAARPSDSIGTHGLDPQCGFASACSCRLILSATAARKGFRLGAHGERQNHCFRHTTLGSERTHGRFFGRVLGRGTRTPPEEPSGRPRSGRAVGRSSLPYQTWWTRQVVPDHRRHAPAGGTTDVAQMQQVGVGETAAETLRLTQKRHERNAACMFGVLFATPTSSRGYRPCAPVWSAQIQ